LSRWKEAVGTLLARVGLSAKVATIGSLLHDREKIWPTA
jgi:hypothetical protein